MKYISESQKRDPFKGWKGKRRTWLSYIAVFIAVSGLMASCNGGVFAQTDTPIPIPSNTVVPPTVTITPTETPTSTPKPTPTPSPRYACPINPDSATADQISFTNDIKTGKLAEWVLKQPRTKVKISANPSKLDYTFDISRVDGRGQLGAQLIDDPGWTARHSLFFGTCKISPEELGFPGKDMGRLLITIIQDKNDKRAVQFTFAAEHFARELFEGSQLTDQVQNWIVPLDDASSYSDPRFIPKGAKPGSSADLRPMEDSDLFFAAQGTTKAEVAAMFQNIADTDIFSDEIIQKLHTTVFYTGAGWNYRD